jgi:RimJ/RimL family protein N-acetyltransferase
MPSQLKLVDATLALLNAAVEGREALETLLQVSIAEGWEGFPEALPVLQASYHGSPEPRPWGSLLFIRTDVPVLVGLGGFKGPPSAEGVVEIGYAIAPAHRGQGLATDAVAQMIQRAFADAAVRAVDAHTLGCDNPSTRVLQRSGFRKIAEWDDPAEGSIWHWRVTHSSAAVPSS